MPVYWPASRPLATKKLYAPSVFHSMPFPWFLFVTKQQPPPPPWQTMLPSTIQLCCLCLLANYCVSTTFSVGKWPLHLLSSKGIFVLVFALDYAIKSDALFWKIPNFLFFFFCLQYENSVYLVIIHKVRIITNILMILEVQLTVFGTLWFVCVCVKPRLQKALWTITCCSVYRRYSEAS